MGLDDLVQAVERVRETARKHQGFLSQSEALTRYCLVDPMLRALGWDTANPEQVRVEEGAGATVLPPRTGGCGCGGSRWRRVGASVPPCRSRRPG